MPFLSLTLFLYLARYHNEGGLSWLQICTDSIEFCRSGAMKFQIAPLVNAKNEIKSIEKHGFCCSQILKSYSASCISLYQGHDTTTTVAWIMPYLARMKSVKPNLGLSSFSSRFVAFSFFRLAFNPFLSMVYHTLWWVSNGNWIEGRYHSIY